MLQETRTFKELNNICFNTDLSSARGYIAYATVDIYKNHTFRQREREKEKERERESERKRDDDDARIQVVYMWVD